LPTRTNATAAGAATSRLDGDRYRDITGSGRGREELELGRDRSLEATGEGGIGGAGTGPEEDRVEAAGEGWRIGVKAVGEGSDCVGRQRRAVDLGGFQQEGQSCREVYRDAGEL